MQFSIRFVIHFYISFSSGSASVTSGKPAVCKSQFFVVVAALDMSYLICFVYPLESFHFKQTSCQDKIPFSPMMIPFLVCVLAST